MARRPSARKPNASPRPGRSRCDGFALLAGPDSAGPEEAFSLAATVVGRVLGPGWRVVRLGGDARPVHVVRVDGRPLTAARAWDLVRTLRADRDVQDVDPLFRVPGIYPRPEQVATGRAPRKAFFEEDEPLDCAADTPEWSLDLSGLKEAWGLPLPPHGMGRAMGEGIVVGHPDTGYTRHDEIFDPARLLVGQGYDFEEDDPDSQDTLEGPHRGHGTSTASVIMSDIGRAAGGPHVTGAAPRASRHTTGVGW